MSLTDVVNNSCEVEVSQVYGDLFSDGNLLCNDDENKPLLLASEQIVHLMDGWKYFSSSLNALLNNSENNAIHFAYYGQLRGALSLFSGKGIRLKFRDSFYIDQTGVVQPFHGNQTHDCVWKIWKQWKNSNNAQEIIETGFKLQTDLTMGVIKNSLSMVDPALTLNNLGYDFFHLKNDHDERNRRSYQADQACKEFKLLEKGDVDFVKELHELLLPSIESSLKFDNFLVSYLVDIAAVEYQENSAPDKTKDEVLDTFIQRLSDDTGLSCEVLESQLGYQGFKVLEYASDEKTNMKNILSRTLFMLRIATLSVQRNIEQYGNQNIKDWFLRWHESVGNIVQNSEIELVDLSQDLLEAIDNLNFDENDELPAALWNAENINFSYKLTRPDMMLAWGL